MTSFRDGPKSSEKTAANGAALHFRNERNFFWAHSSLCTFCFATFLESGLLKKGHRSKPGKPTPKNIFKKHPGKLDRDIGSHRTAPAPLCAISRIEGSSTQKKIACGA